MLPQQQQQFGQQFWQPMLARLQAQRGGGPQGMQAQQPSPQGGFRMPFGQGRPMGMAGPQPQPQGQGMPQMQHLSQDGGMRQAYGMPQGPPQGMQGPPQGMSDGDGDEARRQAMANR